MCIYKEGDRDLKYFDLRVFRCGSHIIWSTFEGSARFSKIFWNIVVMDEAQNLKNARSQTSLAIQSLVAGGL